MRNPGYSCIARKILWFLDHQDQMACRLVSPTWKAHMDQPSFWIKKCDQRGQTKELHDAWIDLIQRIEEEGSYLEPELLQCLMKWYGKIKSSKQSELDGYAPIHVFSILKFIISYSSDALNVTKPNNGSKPIHLAAANGHTEIVKFLASKMENPNESRRGDLLDDGATPIHFAAQSGHIKIVEFLESLIEDPNIPGTDGRTPIYTAAANGHTEIVKFLASKVENPNQPYMDQTGHGLIYPILIAARYGYTEIVKFLASVVDNPNPAGLHGWTPMHVAAHTETLKFLTSIVENSFPVDLSGRTPLDWATQYNHTEIVEFLTKHLEID